MIEHDILRSTVNPNLPLPEAESINETKLVELCVRHRAYGRLLKRIDREARRPRWCGPGLLVKLRAHHFRAMGRLRAVTAEAHALICLIPSGGQPLIYAKGFSAYALTGDPRYLHYCSDLDVFAADLPRFWEDVQTKRGYRGERHYTHEYAKGARGDVPLDLHEYLPVLSLKHEGPLEQQSVSAAANPGKWQAPTAKTEETRISYGDLLPNCRVCGPETSACGLLVPELTLTTLLSCSNLHRDHVRLLHYFGHDQPFRLGSLADIQDLARHPRFDREKFRDFVERWNAQEAVALTAELSERFLGENHLPVGGSLRHFVAEELFWGGLVIPDKDESDDDVLLVRDMSIVLRRLGLNDVSAVADDDGMPRSYATADTIPDLNVETEVLPRIIWRGSGVLPFRFRFSWSQSDRLTLDFQLVKETVFDCEHELIVHLGDDSYVLVRIGRDGGSAILKQRREPAAPFGSVSLESRRAETVSPHGAMYDFRLTWISDFASSAPCEPDALYAMIAVCRLSAENAAPEMREPQHRGRATDDVTYVPLRIHRSVGTPVAVL